MAIRTTVKVSPPGPGGWEAAMEFHVIWEIDIEAKGPKEAAQQARAIQLITGMSATVFDVWAYAAGKMHRIDLIKDPDRLDRDEFIRAVSARLRRPTTTPDSPLMTT